MSGDNAAEALLQAPDASTEYEPVLNRTPSIYHPLHTFDLPTTSRTYTQQFSDLYFSRLTLLKPSVIKVASTAWAHFRLGSETATHTDRVLDVRQGELCWAVGTVFMEMPLKPNVLEDVGREHWIAAPVGRHAKFFAEEDEEGGDADGKQGFGARKVMLEDESGRLRLTGDYLDRVMLVTGAIVAVLGTENADGEFEVLDLKVPDLAPQPERWTKTTRPQAAETGKIALVSGLGITGEAGDTIALDLLSEYLLGELGSSSTQSDSATISRLLIVGNSLAAGGPIPPREEVGIKKAAQRKYGYDSSAYNSAPTDMLDDWLAGLLPSIPITLLPGDADPTQAALPQQPVHAALFPRSRAYMPPPTASDAAGKAKQKQPIPWFHSVTNPWEGEVDGLRVLATGGQPVEDMCKYVRGDERTEIMESILRWRNVAPTAPDTLWCYPFQSTDPFVLSSTPHVFVAGNQPHFETSVISGPPPPDGKGRGVDVRVIALPRFRETGEIVLLDMKTLEVELVRFDVFGAQEGGATVHVEDPEEKMEGDTMQE